jgi:LmbE family N-acetylglucosaminyl deacetylase
MLKKNVLFVLFLCSCIGFSKVELVQAQEEQSKPVVFLLAHQDDEMFLAGNIKKQVDAGKEVYVIVITDGGASKVRKILNTKKSCSSSSQDKKTTQIKRPLSHQEFSAARNKEFFASITSLGVPVEHILFANDGGVKGTASPRYKDGKLTKVLAEEVIKKIYNKLGDGVYNTLAPEKIDAQGNKHPAHHDHRILSNALAQYSTISEKHFFSESATTHRYRLTHKQAQSKQRALRQYYVCKPDKERFAVGAQSVERLFEEWMHSSMEYESTVSTSGMSHSSV